jgi:hypothetical protein
VNGEPLSFLIEERYREEPRDPSSRELAREKRDYLYHAPRVTMIPTGALRIVRIDSTSRWFLRRKSCYDQGRRLLEQKIPNVLAAFYDRAREIKAERAEAERRHREEEERERLRKDKEERRAAKAKLISELDRQAAAWHRARFLRRYIQAAPRALVTKSVQTTFRGETIHFLDWATAYVRQLDPLSPQPTNADPSLAATTDRRPDEATFDPA